MFRYIRQLVQKLKKDTKVETQHPSSHSNGNTFVACSFCGDCVRHKNYFIRNKDDYDIKNSFLLENGVYSVEEYYYIKGRTIGFQVFLELHQDKR